MNTFVPSVMNNKVITVIRDGRVLITFFKMYVHFLRFAVYTSPGGKDGKIR